MAPRPKRHKCGSGTNGPAQFVSLLVGVAATWGAALSWRVPGRAAVTACPGLNGTPVVDIFVNFAYCFIAGPGMYYAPQYVELFHLLFLDFLGRKLDKRILCPEGRMQSQVLHEELSVFGRHGY